MVGPQTRTHPVAAYKTAEEEGVFEVRPKTVHVGDVYTCEGVTIIITGIDVGNDVHKPPFYKAYVIQGFIRGANGNVYQGGITLTMEALWETRWKLIRQ